MISRQVTRDQRIEIYSASNSMASSLEIALMEVEDIKSNITHLLDTKKESGILDTDRKSFEVLHSLIEEVIASIKIVEDFAEDIESATDLKDWYNKQPLRYLDEERK